jgi:carboxy-cis,cis-muconate cyclase
MCGTWVKPGVIITVSFDTETLKLELVKKTEIPHDEPISWMAFDVCSTTNAPTGRNG